ncbi:MAG: hypothetical protein GF355_16660, partial [Candidatus Eisenbacteria bacterium]|nr:hypothetical protein [Candidatus Eisenbacteria bacterium]
NSVNAYTQIGQAYRSHDDNGNLTFDGTRYFAYDYRNNLVQVTSVASYEFDALNRRTKKCVNASGETTRFIYDGHSVIEEYDQYDNLIHLFVNGQQIDEPRVMIGPDYADVDGDENTTEEVRLYFHADQIGSIVAVTGPDETIVEQYEYMPYGEVTIKDGQGTDLNGTSAILNPFMFTARRLDEETSLYHYRHRAYDPVAGRFLQRDPLEYSEGPDLYVYASCSPLSNVDPMGMADTPMHGKMCREVASDFGFSSDAADEIAAGSEHVDKASPELPHAHWMEDETDQDEDDTDAGAKAFSRGAVDEAIKNALAGDLRAALFFVGVAMHPYQDRHYHDRASSNEHGRPSLVAFACPYTYFAQLYYFGRDFCYGELYQRAVDESQIVMSDFIIRLKKAAEEAGKDGDAIVRALSQFKSK